MNSHIAIQTCKKYKAYALSLNNIEVAEYMDGLILGITEATKFYFTEACLPKTMYLSRIPCPFSKVFYEYSWSNGNYHGLLIEECDNRLYCEIFRNAEISILEPQSIRFYMEQNGDLHWYVMDWMAYMFTPEEAKKYVNEAINLILACNQIMACRNIIYENNKPSNKLVKKRLKNNKLPLFAYNTLQIKKDIIKNNQQGYGLKHNSPRFHMRRGHIRQLKDHSVWVTSTSVGDPNRGVIVKNYNIK